MWVNVSQAASGDRSLLTELERESFAKKKHFGAFGAPPQGFRGLGGPNNFWDMIPLGVGYLFLRGSETIGGR